MSQTKRELRPEVHDPMDSDGGGHRVRYPHFRIDSRFRVVVQVPNMDRMMDDEHELYRADDLEEARTIMPYLRAAFLRGESWALAASIREMQEHLMATDAEAKL